MVSAFELASPLGGRARSGGIHKNAPHDLSRDSEEMNPIFPTRVLSVHQAQVCLIYERGGLKRVAGPLLPHLAPGHPVEFGVDQRYQPVQRRLIAIAPSL